MIIIYTFTLNSPAEGYLDSIGGMRQMELATHTPNRGTHGTESLSMYPVRHAAAVRQHVFLVGPPPSR